MPIDLSPPSAPGLAYPYPSTHTSFPWSVMPTEPPDLPWFTASCRVHTKEGNGPHHWPRESRRTPHAGGGGALPNGGCWALGCPQLGGGGGACTRTRTDLSTTIPSSPEEIFFRRLQWSWALGASDGGGGAVPRGGGGLSMRRGGLGTGPQWNANTIPHNSQRLEVLASGDATCSGPFRPEAGMSRTQPLLPQGTPPAPCPPPPPSPTHPHVPCAPHDTKNSQRHVPCCSPSPGHRWSTSGSEPGAEDDAADPNRVRIGPLGPLGSCSQSWWGWGFGREGSEVGGEGRSVTQKSGYQKWPNQIFPIENFVSSRDGHFGLGGSGGGYPPSSYGVRLF